MNRIIQTGATTLGAALFSILLCAPTANAQTPQRQFCSSSSPAECASAEYNFVEGAPATGEKEFRRILYKGKNNNDSAAYNADFIYKRNGAVAMFSSSYAGGTSHYGPVTYELDFLDKDYFDSLDKNASWVSFSYASDLRVFSLQQLLDGEAYGIYEDVRLPIPFTAGEAYTQGASGRITTYYKLISSPIGPTNSKGLFPITGMGLYAAAPAVPEPETYAMLLAGLGLMGVVARRRRRS